MQNKPLIFDEELSLTFLDESMYFDVWQNSLDDNNRKFVPDEVFETLEDAKEVVDYLIECYKNENEPHVYAVIRNSDQVNLGYVQLIPIPEGYEVGYHIAQKYNGNGYATRGLSLLLKYIKETRNLKEVYGIALASNKASRRVLEKNGFVLIFEGMGQYQGKRRKIIRTIKTL